jgi:transposase
MKAIPVSARKAAVDAYLSGKGTAEAIAAEFGITTISLHRYVRAARQGQRLDPKPHAGGAPRRVGDEEDQVIRAFLASHPQATLDEVREHLAKQSGTRVSRMTLYRALHRLGIRRDKVSSKDAPHDPHDDKKRKRYGYGPRHRREKEKLDIRYASSLTDAEWELVQDLFENDGPGRPPVHGRREMLDAICYVVRSGCAWRMLPNDFPKWQGVYAIFRRWASQGRFGAMHDRMRSLWRAREGRETSPTAAVMDSQSIKTAEKGGSSVMTQARKSRAANVTL